MGDEKENEIDTELIQFFNFRTFCIMDQWVSSLSKLLKGCLIFLSLRYYIRNQMIYLSSSWRALTSLGGLNPSLLQKTGMNG